MKKAIIISIIFIVIIILTLTIMPFALNADMVWKSHTVGFSLPNAGITYNWSNPNGNNVNFVLVEGYEITNPSDRVSFFFTQDGTYDDVTVTGIGTPNISVILPSGAPENAIGIVIEYRWGESVRTSELVCQRVWINEDNDFQFIFWYSYADNNWVKIYDMAGNMVYEIDMPYDNLNLIVDLPDGMYTVKTFTVSSTEPIQTFIIGKP